MTGIAFAAVVPLGSPLRATLEAAAVLEEAGCEALFVAAPPAPGPGAGRPDVFVTLGAMAARTSRVALGAIVDPLAERHPALLAKVASSLDVVAGGRALLLADARPAIRQRRGGDPGAVARFGEAVAVIATLFSPGPADHDGPTYRLQRAWNEPRATAARGSIGVLADAGTELADLLGPLVRVDLVLRPPGVSPRDDPARLTLVPAGDPGELEEVAARRAGGDLSRVGGLAVVLGANVLGDLDALRGGIAALVPTR